jgi:ABC-type antimicrobial peptide transport system ATPase subunit
MHRFVQAPQGNAHHFQRLRIAVVFRDSNAALERRARCNRLLRRQIGLAEEMPRGGMLRRYLRGARQVFDCFSRVTGVQILVAQAEAQQMAITRAAN